MPDDSRKPMSIEDFLQQPPPPGGRRQELYCGQPVTMAPSRRRHSRVTANLVALLSQALRDGPCEVFNGAGLCPPIRANSWYEADLAVACRQDERLQEISDPLLIIEVLAAATEDSDRKIKLFAYRHIPSLREILLLDSGVVHAELHRRLDDGRWTVDLFENSGDVLTLASIGVVLPLAEAYRRVDVDAEGPGDMPPRQGPGSAG